MDQSKKNNKVSEPETRPISPKLQAMLDAVRDFLLRQDEAREQLQVDSCSAVAAEDDAVLLSPSQETHSKH
jgi:hypothetical protein